MVRHSIWCSTIGYVCAVGCCLAVTVGCGSTSTSPSGTPTAGTTTPAPSPTPTPSPTSGSSLSFKIDGSLLTATSVTATFTNGVLAVGGGDASKATILGFALATSSVGAGTYTLGPLSSANAFLQLGNPALGWNAAVGIGSGSIVLTTLTTTSASGTFSFNLVALPNTAATGTKAITEGAFNVKF